MLDKVSLRVAQSCARRHTSVEGGSWIRSYRVRVASSGTGVNGGRWLEDNGVGEKGVDVSGGDGCVYVFVQ